LEGAHENLILFVPRDCDENYPCNGVCVSEFNLNADKSIKKGKKSYKDFTDKLRIKINFETINRVTKVTSQIKYYRVQRIIHSIPPL